MKLSSKDLLTIHDLSASEFTGILDLADAMKAHPERFRDSLQGKTLAMIFEKPSLRTRVTFETGMTQMGGHGIYLAPADIQLGARESIPDVARNLERWVDAIMARTFKHDSIVQLARHAKIPVINALSDYSHPCQALADFQTLRELTGNLRALRLTYVGDGNNVCHSLMFAAAKAGSSITVATPPGYEPSKEVVELALSDAGRTGAKVRMVSDPVEGVRGAGAVYTDVWASMGQEAETESRAKIFKAYQVNEALMSQAAPGAVFLHCLPAHRGWEVTDAVADAPTSAIFQQAENRLHAQKAVLHLLAGKSA
ncbi:MAG TPA: ornithine carbamoyltransferase [Candidatus Polarisedimenticolia bacterium]|jgi:ornithine carbamoyltransferase|nr:ornithine carbamoyltransferase [Candidatus Polarisedimenticolia bacterium]